MSINTKVEQIAYGHATALVLSELGQQENWCKAYEYLSECVERGDEPEDLVVWQPFERKRLVRTVLIFTESSDQLSRATDRVPGLPASPGYVQ